MNKILLSFLLFITVYPQTKTNLQVFDSLYFSSINHYSENYQLVNNSDYLIFNSFVDEIKIDTNKPLVKIIILDAHVRYNNVRRNSFLSDLIMDRSVFLSIGYQHFENNQLHKVYDTTILYEDVVAVDLQDEIESSGWKFTQAELPEENIISSIWEPITALGVAAASVILFFLVRSK